MPKREFVTKNIFEKLSSKLSEKAMANRENKRLLKNRPQARKYTSAVDLPAEGGVVQESHVERELAVRGTIKDKVNALTLMVAKDFKNDKAFEELLGLCDNQRNEVIFYILQNVTDLLVNGFFPLHKGKLRRILETQSGNAFIKEKVTGLIYRLLEKDILTKDILYIFVNKLGARDNTFVMAKLERIYLKNREVVLNELQSFYNKHADPRGRISVLDVLGKVGGSECVAFFYEVFNKLDLGVKSTQNEKLIESCLKGLYTIVFIAKPTKGTKLKKNRKDKVEMKAIGTEKDAQASTPKLDIPKLVRCCAIDRVKIVSLSILCKISAPTFIETLAGTCEKVALKDQSEFLNLIYNTIKKDGTAVVEKLLHTALHMNQEFLCGSIVLMKALEITLPYMSTLLAMHFSPVVRYLVEKNIELDPFKRSDFQKLEAMATEHFGERVSHTESIFLGTNFE